MSSMDILFNIINRKNGLTLKATDFILADVINDQPVVNEATIILQPKKTSGFVNILSVTCTKVDIGTLTPFAPYLDTNNISQWSALLSLLSSDLNTPFDELDLLQPLDYNPPSGVLRVYAHPESLLYRGYIDLPLMKAA